MLHQMALVRTDVSEEHIASIFKVTNEQTKNILRGPWSASELYRLSDRYLSTKFSANFCG
jgi:hypothetical protein